jgi:regulator of protease activity HflC (stomatin/prohibitin superfamily)
MFRLAKKYVSNYQSKTTRRNFIVIVHQAEVGFRELLGTNRIRLLPGIRLNIPIIHTFYRVDMRERKLDMVDMELYTKDNVPVICSGTLFFKVIDPEKALFNISNYITSTHAIGVSAVRSVVGNMDYDGITAGRNVLNKLLTENIGKGITQWGVECCKFEVQEFYPKNKEISRQLELQMEAERRRRENELNTHAKIFSADGEKQSSILESEGKLIAAKNNADGVKYKIDTETTALCNQLNEVSKLLGDHYQASRFILEMTKIKNLGKIAENNSSKTYFMPHDSMLSKIVPIAEISGNLFSDKR